VRRPLVRATAVALAMGIAPGAWAQSVILDDGTEHDLTNQVITAGTIALQVLNAGTRAIGSNLSVSTSAANAHAIFVQNQGAVDLDGLGVSTTGLQAGGVLATGAGSSVLLRDADIATAGQNAFGVSVGGGSSGSVLDSVVHVMGFDAAAALASGGATLTVTNSSVTSERLRAVDARGAGSVVRTVNSHLQANGSVEVVRVIEQGRAEFSGGTVTAAGWGFSLDGVGSSLLAEGGIQIGAVVVGARVTNAASLRFDDAHLDVSGGHGVLLIGAGSTFTATASTIDAVVDDGIYGLNGGVVELTDTNVTSGANAIEMSSSTAATNTVSMAGGRLHSIASAIHVAGGVGTLMLSDGAQVGSDSGTIIEVEAAGQLDATFTASAIAGNIKANGTGIVNLALRGGASLQGGIVNGARVDVLSGTSWMLDSNSDVATLDNGGTVGFSAPTGTARTLTVRGNYIGVGGTLSLHTHLGGDDASSDHLHVMGDTSGSTQLAIVNAGGPGAEALNGIRVVQVDGASNGTFALTGRVVGGAFEYALFQGGVSDPADGDWYLRTALATTPPPVPPPVLPPGQPPVAPPVVPPATPIPVYRPEPGIYLANQALATTMFRHRRDDRGALRTTDGEGPERHAWVRATRGQLDATTGAGQIQVGADSRGIEVGSQFLAWTTGLGAFAMGAALHDATAETHDISSATGFRALGEVRGRAASLFGSWSADPAGQLGPSLDLYVQRGKFDHTVQGQGLARETYASEAFATSLEAGYAFQLHQGKGATLYLEPQLQFVHTDYDGEVHVETNGTRITSVDDGGLATRVGVRLFGVVGEVQPYLELNAWHEDTGTALRFDATTVNLALDNITWEGNAGLTVDVGKGWAGWGGMGVRRSSSTRDVHGELGLKYRW
jgi:autotransporter family porin